MKYVGIIESGNEDTLVQQIDISTENITHIIPGGTTVSPVFLTGLIKNLSPTQDMKVDFYTARRESQVIILKPLEILNVIHYPCDRLLINGTPPNPEYAIFSYCFRCNVGDSLEEVTEILYRTSLTLDHLNLDDEYRETNFIQHEGDPTILEELILNYGSYQEVIIKSIRGKARTTGTETIQTTYSIVADMAFRDSGQTSLRDTYEGFLPPGQNELWQFVNLNWIIKRDTSKTGDFRIAYQGDGGWVVGEFEIDLNLEYIFVNAGAVRQNKKTKQLVRIPKDELEILNPKQPRRRGM